MDGLGTLDIAWAQGYDGGKAEYISRDVVCFKCANKIKFAAEDGQDSLFTAPTADGIGVMAVQGIGHLLAFSNQKVNPTIYVYVYPSFRLVAELKDGAKLEYTKLAFSASDYLASVSGVPDFLLTIWNYNTGVKLVEEDIGNVIPSCITFNPANWRQMCVTMEKELSLWQIEHSNDYYVLHKQKLKLPAVDGSGLDEDRDVPTRASTRMSRITINLPHTSVAGVRGTEADKFNEYSDELERVVPTEHVWTPGGDVIMGCTGGQLIKIDGETGDMKMLYNPGPRSSSAMSRVSQTLIREESGVDESGPSLGGFNQMLTEGSVNCLVLSKQGLYVGGQDGMLRQLELLTNQIRVKNSNPLGMAITSLSFNPSHHKLAVGSRTGSMQICDPENLTEARQLFDIHDGEFISVETFGADHCVSIRQDGEVQIWQMEDAKLAAALNIGQQACCLATSPQIHMATVGVDTGHVYFLDLTKPDEPRIVHRIHLHNGPISCLTFSRNGQLLVSGSDDGHVFVLDPRPSKVFAPLGYINMDGCINAISTHRSEDSKVTKIVVTSNTTGKPRNGATRIMHFNLTDDVTSDPTSKHASLKCDFDEAAVKKLIFNFATPSSGIAAAEGNIVYTLCQTSNKIHKIKLPDEPPKKEFSKDSYLQPLGEFEGHQLAGDLVVLSPDSKWLGSCSTDGSIVVRAIGALDRVSPVCAHDYRKGGVRHISFSADASKVLTTGYDGTMSCYKWNFANPAKGKSAVEGARARQMALFKQGQSEEDAMMNMAEWFPSDARPGSSNERAEKEQMEKEQEIENMIEKDAIYTTPTPVPAADATWIQVIQQQALEQEDKQYASLKQDLRLQIREMRRQLQSMMQTNDAVPDIEKLLHHDFDLDIEEQSRLEAEGMAEVNRIRTEKEFENLAKMYLAELIKKQCWDDMMVKGRGLAAFNTNVEVHNYPMKQRDQAELDELSRVKSLRMIEIEELKSRKELVETQQKSGSKAQVDDLNDQDDVENAGKELPATTGSLGAEYGGETDLVYSQFELHTREQKMQQIILLQDAIYRIRMHFNKKFDEVYHKKEQEITKIKEKNRRICKILDDLNLGRDNVYEPEMGVIEKPEMLLTVSDEEDMEEDPHSIAPLDKPVITGYSRKVRDKTPSQSEIEPVKVEKFLTPEQRKKLEESQKAEEERRLREKGDNWRERGLDMMMGGLLEIKKEDELKKDIAVPAFMAAKPEEEWNDDEKKAAAEYERKVKELTEEREKYRKQLEMELKKLQSLIQDGTQLFDETLHHLFIRKIKTEMVIYQEELKIQRMKYSLLVEEELDNREAELTEQLEHKRQLKALSIQAVMESKKNMELFHEQYRNLEAEEKLLDKNFKKEFNDVPAVIADQLYKLFRRRPRGQKARGGDTPIVDPNSNNPFADRPSTARKSDDQRRQVEAALSELDKDSNAPDGCDPAVWDRLCQYRREKVANENLVKAKAQTLAEMEEFWKLRQTEDDNLRSEMEQLNESINRLKEDRLRFTCNLEVQLLVKQGQVEVDAGNYIHDYRSSILIHRSVVEELNGNIRQLGESKIASMVESKDFRKGIIQLEWEHQKMTMEMEDLQNKMRDIQNLKVTREIQAANHALYVMQQSTQDKRKHRPLKHSATNDPDSLDKPQKPSHNIIFLNEDDHDGKKAQEILTLEQTIQLMKQHHEKNVHEKKKIIKEQKRTIRDKEEENNALVAELEDLNVSVNERRHIHQVNADKRSDAGQEQRYREIVQRRKLVDLAKAQAQEVAVLRAEVERLRMRTFPALVQVEH